MEDLIPRFITNLAGRLDGPLHFRFIMQPAMSIFFAVRDGLHDAREQRPAYLWTIFSDPLHRRELLRTGWKSTGKIFLLAIGLELLYQIPVFHTFHPVEALVVSCVLALLPYALFRGPVNRIARRRTASGHTATKHAKSSP
jgi:hypothetical protein